MSPQHGMHEHAHDDTDFADLLDLDAEVLHAYWAAVLGWVRDAAGPGVRRIVDLGAGSGVGAVGLAQRFPDAEVIAIDVSDEMLHRVQEKAHDLGPAGRVRTVRADLDEGWPDIADVDVTWAALSLHHFADPDRVLADIRAATRPGGLLAVAEMAERPRFLPDDLGIGRPGLEARLHDLLRAEDAHALPELGSDWTARLAAAGFAGLEERTFRLDLDPPLPPSTGRYAQRWLARLSSRLDERITADDRATLAALLDGDRPESVLRRDDLRVRGSRVVTLARR